MVVMSLERYAELTDDVEAKLDEADKGAVLSGDRLSHDKIFSELRI